MKDNLAMCANPLGVDASKAGHKNSHLLSLPVEILTAILAYLDVPDMLLCKAVRTLAPFARAEANMEGPLGVQAASHRGP